MGRIVTGRISRQFGLSVAIFVVSVSLAVMGIGCGPGLGADVVVVVGPIPVLGESLQVLAMRNGSLAHERPQMPLGEAKGRSEFSLGLQVPAGLSEPLELTAGVRDKNGCLIAVGSASAEASMMAASTPTVRIELKRVLPPGDTACSDRVPLVLSISPRAASSVGQNLLGERVTPTLQGWGVTPGARWFIDDIEVPTERELSSFLAKDGVPASALGPHKAKVRVRNPDGTEHSRGDLFAYMATTISFAAPVTYTTAPAPKDLKVADFNGDGLPDVALAFAGGEWQLGLMPPLGGVQVFLNQGAGRFGNEFTLTAGRSPQSIAIADFNGDGRPDLAYRAAEGKIDIISGIPWSIGTFINNGTAVPFNLSYELGRIQSVGATINGTDVNGDGFQDVLFECHTPLDGYYCIFTNMNNGEFSQKPEKLFNEPVTKGLKIPIDANKDGLLDFVQLETDIELILNKGSANLSRSIIKKGSLTSYTSGAAADLDNDGLRDIVAFSLIGTTVVINDGANGFYTEESNPLDFPMMSMPNQRTIATLSVADINGDYLPDIIGMEVPSGQVHALLNYGNRKFSPVLQIATWPNSNYNVSLILSDVTGDELPDMLFTNQAIPDNAKFFVYKNSSQ